MSSREAPHALRPAASHRSPANSTSRIASGSPFTKRAHGRRERGIGEREVEHRAIDQLHRARAQLHDVLRGIHRVVEAREVRDAERLVLRQLRRA